MMMDETSNMMINLKIILTMIRMMNKRANIMAIMMIMTMIIMMDEKADTLMKTCHLC